MEKTDGVETFVGIDAHGRQSSIKGVTRQGDEVLKVDVNTSAVDLQNALSDLPGPVWAMVESSSIAPFVKDSIEDHVDRVIVCETRQNRWIAMSENKSDPKDADRLARLLRMGEFKPVHVPRGAGRDRVETLRLYKKIQGDVSRTKNRIKSKYKEHGVPTGGSGVYNDVNRPDYLKNIKRTKPRHLAEILYQKLDYDEEICRAVKLQLITLMKTTREFKMLQTIPGVGEINAAVFSAVIDDPFRFENKRKLWSYSALGVKQRWSGDPGKARARGSKSGNRMMKYAAMTAANAALLGDNEFSRHHAKMIENGASHAMAKRTVARKILAVVLYLLKHGGTYKEKELRKEFSTKKKTG